MSPCRWMRTVVRSGLCGALLVDLAGSPPPRWRPPIGRSSSRRPAARWRRLPGRLPPSGPDRDSARNPGRAGLRARVLCRLQGDGRPGHGHGDLVLREEEVAPVMARLLQAGLSVAAVHNRLNEMSAQVMYMH